MPEKRKIPVRENLWRDSGGGPRLFGSRCLDCDELFFPRKENGVCTQCQSRKLEEVDFSPKGKIYSFTCVTQRPPVYYKGEVPYAIGFVELPEGIRVETLFTDCNFTELRLGMQVQLVIEKLHDDDAGNEVLAYKFKPTTA